MCQIYIRKAEIYYTMNSYVKSHADWMLVNPHDCVYEIYVRITDSEFHMYVIPLVVYW